MDHMATYMRAGIGLMLVVTNLWSFQRREGPDIGAEAEQGLEGHQGRYRADPGLD
jgi:hypothetical protein